VGYGVRCTFLENFDSTYYFFKNHDKLNIKKCADHVRASVVGTLLLLRSEIRQINIAETESITLYR
jgi:hypothetical protein